MLIPGTAVATLEDRSHLRNVSKVASVIVAVGRNNCRQTLRSFVGSCELVKVDPFEWFRDVLARIGEQSIQTLDELLPHRWEPAALAPGAIR